MTKKLAILAGALLLFASIAFATEVIQGTIEKIDTAGKSIVVKAQDGTVHTFHIAQQTLFQGGQSAQAGAENSFHGLKEGSEVAVHYTSQQSQETADEVDRLGNEGLKASQGQLVRIDQTAKTVSIKTQDGTVHVYHLSNNAAQEAGKDITTTAQKSEKVTVYYTEQAGHKVAHFFSRKD